MNKVKLNMRGVNQLLRAAQPKVDQIGEKIAANAKGNYRYVRNPHRWTARGHIEPADAETARKDVTTNELLKAVGRSIE